MASFMYYSTTIALLFLLCTACAGASNGQGTWNSSVTVDNRTEVTGEPDEVFNVTDEPLNSTTSSLELSLNESTTVDQSRLLDDERQPLHGNESVRQSTPDIDQNVTSTPASHSTNAPWTNNTTTANILFDESTTIANEPRKLTWFVLTLEGNCSVITRGRQGQGEKSFKNQIYLTVRRWLEISGKDDLTVNDIRCNLNDRIHVNFTVNINLEADYVNLTSRLDKMEALRIPLLRVHEQDLYVYQIHLWDGAFLNKEPEIAIDLKHTDVELVVYIAVGSSCAFLLVLAFLLLLCKYCCSHQSNYSEPKSFDIPRATSAATDRTNNCNNLRLEDYTLTRIPRPKFGYGDYYRGVTKRYCPLDDKIVTSSSAGLVQPFDTSLVPLEDVYYSSSPPQASSALRDFRDGVIVRPSDVRRFGGSLSKIYRSQNSWPTEGDNGRYSARSNEHLHPAKADQQADQGLDNPNFQR